MSNKLPQGWVECKLGLVFNIANGDRGKNYPAKNKLHTFGIPFVSAVNIQNSELSVENLLCLDEQQYNLLRSGKINKGDTLLCIRGSIGKHCIYQLDKGAIASSMVIIRQIAPSIDKFLFYYLESFCFRQEVKKYDNGTAQPNLSATDLKKFNYPLPPRNEQRRIVEKIESEFKKIDEGLEYLLNAKEQIKQYRQSVLKAAFEGKLYKTTEWKIKSIEEITSKIIGGGTPSKKIPQYYKGKIPFMTVKDMTSSRPVDTEWHITQEAIDNSSTNIIPKDTIIIATRVGLGKIVRVKFDTTINQDLKALILKDYIDKNFCEYLIIYKTPEIISKGRGTTVKGITLEELKNIKFSLPTLDEQRRIVEDIETRFALADKVEKVVDDNIKQAKQLKQSILKKAFEGRLVPQDPTDEPASVLLEKIKKEKNYDRK